MKMIRLFLMVVILILGLTATASAQDTTGNEPGGPDLDETTLIVLDPASAEAFASTQDTSGFAPSGPGLHETALIVHDPASPGGVDLIPKGSVRIWNTQKDLNLTIDTFDDWLIKNIAIYVDSEPVPVDFLGIPVLRKFPFVSVYRRAPVNHHSLVLNLSNDLGFSWGSPYESMRIQNVSVYLTLVRLDNNGWTIETKSSWAAGPGGADGEIPGFWFGYEMAHPLRGHFIDSPVQGLSYQTRTHQGNTMQGDDDGTGGFEYFPDETIDFWVGSIYLGQAQASKRVSPLDLFSGADIDDPRVANVAWLLQSLDADGGLDGKISITPASIECLDAAVSSLGLTGVDFVDDIQVENVVWETRAQCSDKPEVYLAEITKEEAKGNLEAGLNASGIFRKNISKTEDEGESKQKMEVMPVYLPGQRSNGDPSLCVDVNEDGLYDEGEDTLGVPYEEWRLGGDPAAEECDPRDYEDPESCVITLIECREVAKPIVITYTETTDIYDEQVNTEFSPGRFSTDIYTAVSRDDGTTWKRMNVSRMADLSSFELDTGESFPGTSGSPYLKIDDNYILNVWQSKFCRSGNPRYSIQTCDDPATEEVEWDNPDTEENECAIYCNGNAEKGTEVCEPDYPYDDDYFVTDIWGVRGQQRSVNYDEVDDVAELGIGEIPYSCLWAARGVIVTQKELEDGTFDSLTILDDPDTEEDESDAVALGDIVWYKPERLTSGRRDAYIPAVGSARGAGFAIAWQEDPTGLRPGKGKGPGEGWSGAISNHKTDIWYSFISSEDFARVDAMFVPGGPGADPNGGAQYDEKPGLGRPKSQVPFSLPIRVSDNDMVNTDTLKVEQSSMCVTPPEGTEPVCFPEVVDGTFVPLDPEEIEVQFCGHPDADPATCCDPENHEDDPNCEDLKGLYGNLTGTKRYAYLAKGIDEYDNVSGIYQPEGDGIPDYQHAVDNGGTLNLCDTSGANLYMDALPGTSEHQRWFDFANSALASKLVCITSDGRLLDGDVSASWPNIQLQPYTKSDGTKSAWVLLGYEESKGLGHSLAASEHDNPVDEIIGDQPDDTGQEKPIKQDLGKNVIYHSFDFTQPDLVSPGHIVNLPALCGGLYPTYCDDPKTPDVIETVEENPTCTCDAGQPIPLYFDYLVDTDGDPDTPDEWIPDENKFLQYRTEIARRVRFIVQSPGRMGPSQTLGAIIFKQGQEGQGRPADVFIRRIVKSGKGNPYKFENFECTTYLDESNPAFTTLKTCPTDGVGGYNCNVWGEASGDRLCGGVSQTTAADGTTYDRRDHINLTSANIGLAVDAGPVDDTPDDPTDDRYGTNKVLLWTQSEANLGDESFGLVKEDGTPCDVLAGEECPAMYANSRSHRGFIRGDFLVAAYAYSPNWAAARNGNDRYNFYIRKSFDGGQTWTTTPGDLGGEGVYICPEWRPNPDAVDPDGSGNLPPEGIDPACDPCPYVEDGDGTCMPTDSAIPYAAGAFEPARNMSEIKNNKETSSDPRVGATPPTYPLDGRDPTQPNLCPNNVCVFTEDTYVDNIFFVAWGTGDNQKKTGTNDLGGEASPLDLYYTRSEDFGDTFLKVPWYVRGENSNQYDETVWRYERLAWGEEEQGECQLKATSDGSKAYAIYHQLTPEEEDPDAIVTRWYPWEVEESHDNDLWYRRLIFWPEDPAEELLRVPLNQVRE